MPGFAIMLQLRERFQPTFYKKPEFYYRAYNAFAAGVETYQLLSDPDRALELLPDITLHAIEATFPNSMNNIMAYANSFKLLHGGIGFATRSLPSYFNFVDLHFHTINLVHRWNKLLDEDDNEQHDQAKIDNSLNPRNTMIYLARTVLGRKPKLKSDMKFEGHELNRQEHESNQREKMTMNRS